MNNPEDNQWREEGRRADYFEPDTIVFPINIVAILLSQQAEKQRGNKPKCENEYCRTPESPVTYGPDPFRSEIHNDDTEIWKCEKCRYESAMDI